MIRPGNRAIGICLAASSLCVALALYRLFFPELANLSWVVIASAALLCAVLAGDAWKLCRYRRFTLARHVRQTLPVGQKHRVRLEFSNREDRPLKVTLVDHYPDAFQLVSKIEPVVVPARAICMFSYTLRPVRRGDAVFPQTDVLITSPLGLWQRKLQLKLQTKVKVFPDFASILQLAGLEFDQLAGRFGIHVHQRRGEGQQYRQLREFRRGDSLRSVDWKATSRMHQLISREYQDERDQEVIFLLDTGRRLHGKDGDLSHFDLCLNAVILLAYVALNKGDKVGFRSFAGDALWLPARGGPAALPYLLRHVYGLHSSLEAPDYLQAAANLLVQQKRRALVVLLSNFSGDEHEELATATQMLKKRHLVLAASMREPVVDATLNAPVTHFGEALQYAGTCEYLLERNRLLLALRANGIKIVDCLPRQLASNLVNEYLALKKSGTF